MQPHPAFVAEATDFGGVGSVAMRPAASSAAATNSPQPTAFSVQPTAFSLQPTAYSLQPF